MKSVKRNFLGRGRGLPLKPVYKPPTFNFAPIPVAVEKPVVPPRPNKAVIEKNKAAQELKLKIQKLDLNSKNDAQIDEMLILEELALENSTEGRIMKDIKNTVNDILKKPMNMIVLVLCLVVVLSHTTGLDSGFMKELVREYNGTAVVQWLIKPKNFEKFLGGVVFVPALLDLQTDYRVGVTGFVVVWLFLMPNLGLWEYVVQAVLLHTFIKVKLNSSRYAIIFASVILFLFGIITFKTPKLIEKKNIT